MATVNETLYVQGSVIATENEVAGKIVSAGQDVGAGRDVTAIQDVAAGRNVVAGNIISANVDVGAGRDVVAQRDVVARTNLVAQEQPTHLSNGFLSGVLVVNSGTLPTSQPGLELTGTDGNRYVLYIDTASFAVADAATSNDTVPTTIPVIKLVKLASS